jgi:nucleotide-binding universal stress UspA family protein
MIERIVVGVDGSTGGAKALAWAVEEAERAGATVEAVSVWHTPYVDAYAYTTVAIDTNELAAGAQAIVDEAVEAYRDRVKIETHVACGAAASVLIDEARNADLLVVGSRGRGGFAGLLLGSVSQQVSHHAPCAVVIVPSS